MDNTTPVALVTLSFAAGGIAKILVDFLTMGWPSRPTWVAPTAALVLGILATFLVTLSEIPSDAPLHRQLLAQIFGAGILAAAFAVGLTASGNSAEAKRQQALPPPPPPDPEMPPQTTAELRQAPPHG